MCLEYGNENIRFKYRTIEGVPAMGVEPDLLILDGQQRLTSMYGVAYSKNAVRTKTEKGKDVYRFYYFDINKCLDESEDRLDAIIAVPADKKLKTNFDRDIILDLSKKELEYEHEMFPINIIFDSSAREDWADGMNQYYSAELSQKVKRGMNESRQRGTFTGGFIIFGYRVENKKIIIHEDEAEVVRWMFNECASGKLVKTIIEELHEKGVLYRGKPFARNTVYHLLANEKYSGIYRHGEEVFTNMYPRIVPQDIFDAVKSKIDSNKYGKHKPNVVYLLKNKVKCGYCGKSVNSDAGTSKNGSIMRYYKCSGKRVSKQC